MVRETEAETIADPSGRKGVAASESYREYQMYDQRNDPHELVNLAGRQEYTEVAGQLRSDLKKLIVEAGEPEPQIESATLYPRLPPQLLVKACSFDNLFLNLCTTSALLNMS